MRNNEPEQIEEPEDQEELDEATGLPRYLMFAPSATAMASGEAIRQALEQASRKVSTSSALNTKQEQERTNLPLFAAMMQHVQNIALDIIGHNYKISEWVVDQLDQRDRNEGLISAEATDVAGSTIFKAREQFLKLRDEVTTLVDKLLVGASDGSSLADLATELKVLQIALETRGAAVTDAFDTALVLLTPEEDEDEDEEDDDAEEEGQDEAEEEDDGGALA